MKNNKEVCQEKLDALKEANEQWFYGHNVEFSDFAKMVDAIGYFTEILEKLATKLELEGKL